MRSLSLVKCIEVEFSGKLLKDGLALGDVDNDGLWELAVGNTEGELRIFRGDKVICKATELGTISAVVIGDLLNLKRNVTVVITVEGWCHVFDVEWELGQCQGQEEMMIMRGEDAGEVKIIQPFHSQRIVANIKEALIGDVDQDGRQELIVALTDRVVRTYEWSAESDLIEEGSPGTGIIGGGGGGGVGATEGGTATEDLQSVQSVEVFNGRLKAMNKWEFANQIGSISLHTDGDGDGGKGKRSILVSQPGGKLAQIWYEGSNTHGEGPWIVKHLEGMSNCVKLENEQVGTDVVGKVRGYPKGEKPDHYALATNDGVVMLGVVEGETYPLTKLNCPVLHMESHNGTVVIVSWEGETYLMKRSMDFQPENCILHFSFEEEVQAFKVGPYGISLEPQKAQAGVNLGGKGGEEFLNEKCLVYVSFHGSIYIYPNEYL